MLVIGFFYFVKGGSYVRGKKLELENRTLIKDLSFSFQPYDKLAIIGEEGNGKSTLLKCIYDKKLIENYAKVTGTIIRKNMIMGYLEQFLDTKWENQTIEDYFIKENPDARADYEKYNEFYQLEAIFKKLHLKSNILNQNQLIGTLSGGEKVKIQIAKILMKQPDVLLLDEPTNDIDLKTLEWMEEFILRAKVPIIYISHDEVLLQKTANAILHLEQIENKQKSRYTLEHIDYLSYIQKRADLLTKQEQIAKNEKREKDKQEAKWRQIYQSVDHQQEAITRQNPSKGRLLKKKMKSVKSMEKRIINKEITKRPIVEEQIVAKFHQEDTIYDRKVILNLNIDKLMVGGKILQKDLMIHVIGKEKIGIIGENGCGKTTLLRKIYEILKQRQDIKVGYMPQNYEDEMNDKVSVIKFLIKEGGREEQTTARTYLASMKLTENEILGNLGNLSGGQKAKVYLVKLILQKDNVLLLDEPTRNLIFKSCYPKAVKRI